MELEKCPGRDCSPATLTAEPNRMWMEEDRQGGLSSERAPQGDPQGIRWLFVFIFSKTSSHVAQAGLKLDA